MTVEPVVVMPDIDSKKAFVIDSFKFEKIKGIDPNNAINIQLSVVNRNACLIVKLKLSVLLAKIKLPDHAQLLVKFLSNKIFKNFENFRFFIFFGWKIFGIFEILIFDFQYDFQ